MRTPHDLETIERWMQTVIAHPSGAAAGIDSAESRQHIEVSMDNLERIVAQSGALTSINCLGIYNHAFFARQQECLRAEFPVLLHALGAELFNLFTFDYLQHYPSRSYTLNRLGENFPRYLAETRPDATRPADARESWPDFIIELAAFERAFSEVFDGPGVEDQQILEADQLSERLCEVPLLPVVCLRLFTFRYPVSQYFTAVRNKEDPSLPMEAQTFIAMNRRRYTVIVHELTARQYEVLSFLIAGQSLNQALKSSAKETDDDFDQLLATASKWINCWTEQGFFSGIVET